MDKKEYIVQLADFLVKTKTTMPGDSFASFLNWNGHQTSYGTDYEGKRGTYTLIRSTYHWLVKQGRQDDADKVAMAFKKPDGTYAYE